MKQGNLVESASSFHDRGGQALVGWPVIAGNFRDYIIKIPYRGTDSKELELADKYRMVDNASELVERLATLKLANVVLSRAIIADEDHNSVSLASIGRALMFAVPK